MSADAIAGLAERLGRLCERDGSAVLEPFEQLVRTWEERPNREPRTQPSAVETLLVAELRERGACLLREGSFTEAEATLFEAKRLNAFDPDLLSELADFFALRAEHVRAGLTDDIPRQKIPNELPPPPLIPRRPFEDSFSDDHDFGPYRIIKEIGRGKTHVVYLARDRYSYLGREVALCVLLDQDPSNEDWRKSLKELAANWLKIRHPAVLRLEDLKLIDENVLYVAEYVEGGVLRAGIGVEVIVSLLPRVCEALVALEDGAVPFGKILEGALSPLGERNGDSVSGFGRALARLAGVESKPEESGAGLVRDDAPQWIQTLIRRCKQGEPDRFPDSIGILEFVRFHVQPREAERVQVSITSVEGFQYDTRRNGATQPRFRRSGASGALIKDLQKKWQDLGSLSLQREIQRLQGVVNSDLDEGINSILEVIRDNSELVLGSTLSGEIAELNNCTLTLMHDPALTGFPWEILCVEEPLCLRFPFSRVPRLREGVIQRAARPNGPLRVVLAGDESVKHCAEEIETLAAKFPRSDFQVETLYSWHKPARLRQALSRCDIFHFAGHGYRNPTNPAENGPRIGSDVLSAAELGDLWKKHAPLLVFANCCYVAAASDAHLPWWLVGEGGQGFGHEVCRVGAANFIGTVLEPPISERAGKFAEIFYNHLLGGRAISHAMLEARRYCHGTYEPADLTWARYILFGDPFTSIGQFSGHSTRSARA